jgi:diadenosine tetraphosphate (Ap4A) HIT family hydrolase
MSPFLDIPRSDYIFETDDFFMIYDRFPVSPGHLLIISKQLRSDYFELTSAEKAALPELIDKARSIIEEQHQPDGYNIGMNCGSAAGQTVMHFHCHVIPRYKGDMADPRGGVRHVVAGKGYYSAEGNSPLND